MITDPTDPTNPEGVATADSFDDLPRLPTDAIEQLPEPSREDIAARARELWRAGSKDTLGNWLQAERELRLGLA